MYVMSGVNPQGCQVFSFKRIRACKRGAWHDFLWRTTRDLPERGRIGIFNRSYYEEVLIARVHPEILRNEGLPDAALDEMSVWHERYRSILGLERHLHANGTRIIKILPPFVEGGAAASASSNASTIRARTGSSAQWPMSRNGSLWKQ